MASAYSYLRFSTPQQAEGDSIRRQTEATVAWCQRNKVTLDTSISLRDEGVSAFRGKNRENPDLHALAALLQAVKSGRIPSGSYLVVESLDRLSREKIRPALTLILNLIDAGIKVVQLIPVEVVYDDKVEPMQLMMAIMELNRGHSESAVKSDRVGKAWETKQKGAAQMKLVSTKLPCWMKMHADGKTIVLDPVGSEVVRRIATMSQTRGITAIAKTLNDEEVPTLGRAKIRGREIKWSPPTIYTLLTSRALVGEYVPYTSTGRGRKPKGKAVPGYFPALLTEDDYQRIQAGLNTRRLNGRGRKGKHVNLLGGLLREASTSRSFTYRHPTGRNPVVVPLGTGETWVSFPAHPLERAILVQLAEVTVADVEGTGDVASTRVADLSATLSGVEALIATWTPKMDDLLLVDRVAEKLRELEGQRRKLVEALATAQREAASPVAEALGNLKSLAHLLDQDNSDETRTKVRAAIRRVVKQIWCAFGHHGATSLASVRVEFVGGRYREYAICYTPKRGGTADLFVRSAAAGAGQQLVLNAEEFVTQFLGAQ